MKTKYSRPMWGGSLQSMQDAFTPEDLSTDEIMIQKTTEKFVTNTILANMEQAETHDYTFAKDAFQEAGSLGLQAVEIPEAYGGFGLGKHVAGLVAEGIGNGGGSFSVAFNIHAGVGTTPFIYYGTEEQKATYLPKLGSGEWVGAYALTEPSAGSDALKGKARATWNDQDGVWQLTGEKQWITNAHIADVYVVFANSDEGMTAFIVERTQDGVTLGPEEKKMGINGSSTATLLLEDVVVNPDRVLGEIGQGHKIALNTLNLARLKLAFNNIGASKRALKLSVNYGLERKQFQQSLVNFPLIQEKLANMNTALFGVESFAYGTAGSVENALASSEGMNSSSIVRAFIPDCAMCKTYASEVLGEISDEAVQIHGGYGFMQEYEVERLYRDARINRIFEGTNEINRMASAKALLKQDVHVNENPISDTDVNGQWIAATERIMSEVLEGLSLTDEVSEKQEVLRMVADSFATVAVMRSSYTRTVKHPTELKEWMTRVICEEGYENVESNMTRLWLALDQPEEANRVKRQSRTPERSDLTKVKRKISERVIEAKNYIS
ncbi:acyl-CoA dehydrogenase family protein [Geomicrobium sp. JSM 1781026]|uniref:acyl-CoA dehydrogenase family protein n=1 Tax=Geomicrobium sp. JSM 1781026 TaxID=3344580 RepID=UPI0035BF1A0A